MPSIGRIRSVWVQRGALLGPGLSVYISGTLHINHLYSAHIRQSWHTVSSFICTPSLFMQMQIFFSHVERSPCVRLAQLVWCPSLITFPLASYTVSPSYSLAPASVVSSSFSSPDLNRPFCCAAALSLGSICKGFSGAWAVGCQWWPGLC